MDEKHVSKSFANERIRAAISALPDVRARTGLAHLDRDLVRKDVAPGLRLHLIAAVKHLSLESRASLPSRLARAEARRKGGSP